MPQLPPQGMISGTVSYSDGTPAANVLLRIVPVLEPGQTATNRAPSFFGPTDSKGAFTLPVAPGRYLIRTPGRVSAFYPGVLNESEARPVVVTANTVSGGLDFSLPPAASGFRVSGRVILPPSYPAPSTSLRVEISPQLSSGVAADGSFEFTHIQPGNVSLSVTAPGVQTSRVTVVDRDVAGVEIIVPRLITVSGTVAVDGGARPRFRLRMDGVLSSGSTLSSTPHSDIATVSPTGPFSVILPEGDYRLSVDDLPPGFYLKTMTSGATDLIGNSLKVVPTDSSIRVAIALGTSPGVRAAGHLTGWTSQESSQSIITLSGVAVNENLETVLREDGSFEFSRIPPGIYYARVPLTGGISSPRVRVLVPNRDIADLEVAVPSPQEVRGRIAVDGNGPPPKFSLLLIRGSHIGLSATRPGELPSLPASVAANLRRGTASVGEQVLELNVNALPDGSFTLKIPIGEYRVAASPAGPPSAGGIPPVYFIRSLTAGSTDLMTEPFRIAEDQSSEIHVGFGTAAPNPWVKVSGQVKGMDPAKGLLRVALMGNVTSTIEAYVDPSGKFEFPVVLQRSSYTAGLVPANAAASAPRITVADKDVSDVQIVIPPEKEITIRTTLEGNNPIPSFDLAFAATDGPSNSMSVVVRPEPDGTFKAKLPADERRVRIGVLPLGYMVRSMTYGSTDIRRQPLRIGETSQEIRIELELDPTIPWGSIRGRVTGLDPDAGSVRIVMNGVTNFATFEATVNADGAFSFPRIPPGTYIPTLDGAVGTQLAPSSIVVSGMDLIGIEIAATRRAGSASRTRTEEASTGATLFDFGGGSSANESAAVANLRTINTAQITFLSASGGKYGSIEDMIDAGLLDTTFSSTKAGFNFSVISIGSEYAAAAIPASPATGRYGFFSTPDAVIRYSAFEPLSPSGQAGRPVQ